MKKLLLLLPILIYSETIKDIKYENVHHLSKSSIEDITNIYPNSKLNLDKIDKSIINLYKQGYFTKISVDYDNQTLTYIFKEKPVIANINYKNFPQADLKEIKKFIKIKKGMVFDEKILKKIKKNITDYYTAKGYFDSIVEINIKKHSSNSIDLNLTLSKGDELIIKKINFIGSKSFNTDDLIEAIKNKPRQVLGWLPYRDNGKLSIFDLELDKNRLRDFYLKHGYLDVKIKGSYSFVDFDSNNVYINYNIKEGKPYIIKSVTITDKQNIISQKKLTNLITLKPNETFNIEKLRQDIKKIKTLYMDKGYRNVQIYPDIQKQNYNASIKYIIIPNQKFYINDVIINGNTKTLDRVIRRNIYLAPGDSYSITNKLDSINALKRSGLFEKVDIKEKIINNNKINFIVNVQEGLTGSLNGGISYGSYDGLGVNLSVREKNVFGSGNSLSLNFNNTDKRTEYSLNFNNPRIFDSLYSFNASIYKKNYTGLSYTINRNGIKLGVGKKLTRYLSENFSIVNEVGNLSEDDEDNIISKRSFIPSLSYNSTNDFWFPTNGIKASTYIDYTGLAGDEKFVKNENKFQYFYNLKPKYNINYIFRYKMKFGLIKDLGYIPTSEKFYLGGIGTVRGYSYHTISPTKDGDYIGGKLYLVNNIELAFPISKKAKLWGSFFIDNGSIGEKDLNINKTGYGFAFEWITPVGRLDFVFSRAYKPAQDDHTSNFEFTIGGIF